MKKLLFLILAAILCATVIPTSTIEAKTEKTNWQICKELCKKEGYKKIKLLKTNELTDKQLWKVVDHRKGKNYIVVEKIVSRSDGTGYGWYSTKTKGSNYIIAYNKKVPKGKLVTSYIIWNPNSNECDNVLWVVDNYKFR